MSEEVVKKIGDQLNKTIDYVNNIHNPSDEYYDRLDRIECKIKCLFILVIISFSFSIFINLCMVILSILLK